MKTDATLAIEKALGYYDPPTMGGIKINKQRARHTAYEVPAAHGTTAFGLIDCVGICEYFGQIQTTRSCFWHVHKGEGVKTVENVCEKGYPIGKKPPRCDEARCRWNVVKRRGEPQILIVCFEIKVTKSDFKSENGHNFVGNLNYYVVPLSLYHEIKDDVPEGIGIIAYYDGSQPQKPSGSAWPVFPYVGLRRKKESAYRELTDEAQKWLILSALKRIKNTPDVIVNTQNDSIF